jgi:hypothetical protein
LQPRGYVHSVSEQIARVHHYVTDMDTNAEVDVPVHRETGVRFGESRLRLHRALDCVNGASKFGKHTIAGRVRYSAPVIPNALVEDRAPFGQAFERANLVSTHEAAVALHIRCEDCDEASADFRRV